MMHPNGSGGCGMGDPVGAGSVAFGLAHIPRRSENLHHGGRI